MTNTPAFPCRDSRLPVPERTETEIRQELFDLGFDVLVPRDARVPARLVPARDVYRGAERCVWVGAGPQVQPPRLYRPLPLPGIPL